MLETLHHGLMTFPRGDYVYHNKSQWWPCLKRKFQASKTKGKVVMETRKRKMMRRYPKIGEWNLTFPKVKLLAI